MRWGGGAEHRGEDEWSQCGQPQWSGSESDIIAHQALRLIMHLKEFISVASVYCINSLSVSRGSIEVDALY